MKRILKIKFVDFWGDFNYDTNFITKVLCEHYVLEISDSPDYLFFSTFGVEHLRYNCVKIMFIGENIAPDFNICDYAIGFDYIEFGDRYLRLPLYQIYASYAKLERPKEINVDEVLNRKFCCIVVSNSLHASPHRERFYRLLSEYKQVDSGGRLWNNVGGPVANKLDFVSQYKFNIAFENSSVLGYTTEKIMEPMAVNTLPIYWGNKLVHRDFNPASFIYVHDFSSMEKAVEYIVKLDGDDSMYTDIIKQPWIVDGNASQWKVCLGSFLLNIIEKPIREAKYLSDYGYQQIYRKNLYSMIHMYSRTNTRLYKLLDKVLMKLQK